MARYGGDDAFCFYCQRQFTSAGVLRQHLMKKHPVLDAERRPIPGQWYGPDFERDADGLWRQIRSADR